MEYITNEAEVDRVAASLTEAPLFAVDTEAAGYHRYHDRICLLQVSTRDATFLIDTLSIRDLSSLGAIFADASHEVSGRERFPEFKELNRLQARIGLCPV